jgi:hypothetical protein
MGLPAIGDSPFAGGDSSWHSLTNWPFPIYIYIHTHTHTLSHSHSHTHTLTLTLSLTLTLFLIQTDSPSLNPQTTWYLLLGLSSTVILGSESPRDSRPYFPVSRLSFGRSGKFAACSHQHSQSSLLVIPFPLGVTRAGTTHSLTGSFLHTHTHTHTHH